MYSLLGFPESFPFSLTKQTTLWASLATLLAAEESCLVESEVQTGRRFLNKAITWSAGAVRVCINRVTLKECAGYED